MKKFIFSIFGFLTFINFSSALGPKEIMPLSSMIGKRIFESPLNEWLEKNDYSNATEELQTDGPVLFIKHYQKGYSLMLDINMTLNTISLYGKGGKYDKYTGAMPFNLKFGMNRDSLYRIIDLRLVEEEDNPFVLTRNWNNQVLQLMFNSRGLNQITIFAPDSLPLANDVNFVRLISYGQIISGDCDSLTGKMEWNNGEAIYEGEWENNLPHGKGYFKDKYDNWYKGEFKYGYFWGQGQMNVAGYYLYNGDFVMSRRHGTGLCKFNKPKGESYEGQWKADVMTGLGKYMKNSRHYYYGNMAKDKFNGQGKLTTPDGWIEGEFKNGLPDGYMKQYLKMDNTMIEGEWKNGKREGKFKVTNTETKKVSYKTFFGDIEIIDK